MYVYIYTRLRASQMITIYDTIHTSITHMGEGTELAPAALMTTVFFEGSIRTLHKNKFQTVLLTGDLL